LSTLAQRRVLSEVQRLLGQPDRGGGPVGQPLQQPLGRVLEFARAHRSVDQAPVGRVPGAHLLAEQQHAPGTRHTDQPGQQPRGSRIRAEAAVHQRFPEHRIVGGQREVAAESCRPSPHGADHRQLDARDEFDHAVGGVGHAPHQIAGARTSQSCDTTLVHFCHNGFSGRLDCQFARRTATIGAPFHIKWILSL